MFWSGMKMIQRRRVLSIGLGGLFVPLSGCTDELGGGPSLGDATSNDKEETTSTGETHKTVTKINDAIEHYRAASDLLRTETDKLEKTGEAVFRTDEIISNSQEGLSILQEALRDASDSERNAIETLFEIGRWLVLFASSIADYGDAVDTIGEAETKIDINRFEEAASQSKRAITTFNECSAHINQATGDFGEIDVSTLEPLGEVSSDIDTGLNDLRERLTRLETYARAEREFAISLRYLSTGRTHYVQAKNAAKGGDLSTALAELKQASGSFGNANEAANDGEDIAPKALLDSFVRLVCMIEHSQKAAKSLINAVSSRNEGRDSEADAALAEATSAEEDAANC